MVEDLFGGWKAVYSFEDDHDVGVITKVTARSYSLAKRTYIEVFGREPSRLVGLEIK